MIDRVGLFSEFDENDKNLIAGLLHEKEFPSGSVVYREGEPGDLLNFVMKGKLNVCKTTTEGEQYCMVSLTEGEIFGIMSFLDGSRHDATIIADSDTQLLTLRKADFDNLLASDTLLAAKVLKGLAMHLARIVRNMNSQYMDLMHYMFRKSK
ncbi:MAG TPA: cyclic nucleotide-binding domain-containing protein [Dissulfurispiraceae bacterium]|nr:cyclic nucleotide-binding domain-containing protein [Dissulfurispiraceae bacterium]